MLSATRVRVLPGDDGPAISSTTTAAAGGVHSRCVSGDGASCDGDRDAPGAGDRTGGIIDGLYGLCANRILDYAHSRFAHSSTDYMETHP